VKIAPFYDRQYLVDNTLHTVSHSVLLGITLVVLVLLLLLGRPAMAALVAVTIPFSLLFALMLMYLTDIPIGLLSIGAIDFGIIVDGAVIMAEHVSVPAAVILLLSVPFASIGGLLALYVRGVHLNVSAGVGFAALFGVSIMNGVLMIRSITAVRHHGAPLEGAILQGAGECLRPILLASLVAVLGLLPASLATGLGSDVQRPLATVIVWGLFSSTVLTLCVLPVLYAIFPPGLPVSVVCEPAADLDSLAMATPGPSAPA
jgi:Cu/Ag efflux pump CusA